VVEAHTWRSAPPPVVQSPDANGVDPASGMFIFSTSEVAIGNPAAGGLSYGRGFIGDGWRPNVIGTVNASGLIFTVSVGGYSETFTQSGSNFSSDQALGSTLTFNAGTNRYTYTTSNGAAFVFDKAFANSGMPWAANEARLVSITAPDGQVTLFHYNSVTLSGTTARRLQSVTNNLGYQLHLTYALDNPTSVGQLSAWQDLIAVRGVNNMVDYCGPSANTCAGFTQTWPSVTYAGAGSTETATDALGRTTTYTYTTGVLTGIRRPSSATTSHIIIGYASGRVSALSNAGGAWAYAYVDGGGTRTTTITDPFSDTLVVTSALATGRVTAAQDQLGRQTSYQYDGSGRTTRVTLPEGNYTSFTYDARGNVTLVRNVAKSGSGLADITVSAVFPGACANPATCNQPTSTTDERGNTTDYTYDANHGGVLTVTQPAPSSGAVRPQARYTYTSLYAYYKNSGGSIVQGPSPLYRVTEISQCATLASCVGTADETRTSFTFVTGGTATNLLPRQMPIAAGNGSVSVVSTLTYTPQGDLQSADGPIAGTTDTTRYRYDAARQLIGVIGPEPDAAGPLKHRAQRFTYNADGQVTLVERGTVNSQSDPDWAAFASLLGYGTTHDFAGRVVRQSLLGGGATQSLTQFSYDAGGRLDCLAIRMNPAVYSSLPASACAASTAGSNGPDRITRLAYDDAYQVLNRRDAYGTALERYEVTYAYTTNGLVDYVEGALGNRTDYAYDGFDRLMRQYWPVTTVGAHSANASDYEQYSYDSASNVVSRRLRNATTVSSTFDALNRPTLLDAPSGTNDVTYGYNNFGQVTSAQITGANLNLSYDALGNLTGVSGAQVVNYQYDSAGRRSQVRWSDGLFIMYSYDTTNAVTQMLQAGSGIDPSVLASFTYDNLGRRATMSRANGVGTSFAYNDAGLLAQLSHNLPSANYDVSLNFTYNAAGQRLTRVLSHNGYAADPQAAGTTNYSRNGLNQYTAVGGASYTHDTLGNLTNDGATGYAYDAYSRMTGGGGATMSYDPLGRLSETNISAAVSRYAYDGSDIIAEYNAGGALLRRYVFDPSSGGPLNWYEGSGGSDIRYLLTDERGSVMGVTDAAGVLLAANAYDEFGIPDSANLGSLQYTGQRWLGAGSVYQFPARGYSPRTGRFLQTDPAGFGAGDMNLYAYVANDPLNFVDPSGLAGCRPIDDQEPPGDEIRVCGVRPPHGDIGWAFDYGIEDEFGSASPQYQEVQAYVWIRPGPTMLPRGVTNNQFGRTMRWGQSLKGAQEWLKNLRNPQYRQEVIENLRRLGVTREQLTQWRDLYRAPGVRAAEQFGTRSRGIDQLLDHYPSVLPPGVAPMSDWDFQCYVAQTVPCA
jgi:RHS repeat-associated protein